MRSKTVSTRLAFVDLLSGALIGLVILHLISPIKAGDNPIEQELEVTFVCADKESTFIAAVDIEGVTYRSDRRQGRNIVQWKINESDNSLTAKIKLTSRPDVSGYLLVTQSAIPFAEKIKIVVQPTLGYDDIIRPLSLTDGYFSRFRLASE